MSLALKQQFPLRLIIGGEDCTFLLDDDFTFSSVDPGGFEAASFSIPKDMPQTLRGTYVRLDSGLGVAFEGRVKEVQRSLGSKTAIQCEGNSALFGDNDGSMVFVDRDLTQWQSPSYSRQIGLVSDGDQIGALSEQVAADSSGLPALVFSGTWPWSAQQICEIWYDAGPENVISSILWTGLGQISPSPYEVDTTGALGAGNSLLVIAASGNGASFSYNGLIPVEAGDLNVTFSPEYEYVVIQLNNDGGVYGSPGDGQTLGVAFENVTLYGNHGLTQRGSAPYGFYPSDIASWIVRQIPGLQAGVIPETDSAGYIVPHAVYYTPVGLDQMIGDMAQQAGWHWGVWESLSPLTGNPTPRCDFRPRPALGTFTGFCLRRDTTTCDIREDLSQQYNKCVVTFTNVDGTNGAVTVTADNPILDQAGIPSRTLPLDGGTMTPSDASLFGLMALAYTYNEARVAGSVQIEQAIQGGGGPMAPWMLKPGIDRLRIGDLPSFDAWGQYNDVPLSRMECSGSSSGFSTSLEVGIGASMVETLQARLTAASALAGVGA